MQSNAIKGIQARRLESTGRSPTARFERMRENKSENAIKHGAHVTDAYDPRRYDPTLFQGSAPYYARYRERYDPVFVTMLQRELALDGSGRLLDIGCGTGNALVPLAPLFALAVGVDPDAGMLAEAQREASEAGAGNVRLARALGEGLPFRAETFDLITVAASLHWMDHGVVLDACHRILKRGGALAHITNVPPSDGIAFGDPAEWPEVRPIIERYLGPQRRAGASLWHNPGRHEPWYEASPFGPGESLRATTGHRRVRTIDDVVGTQFSVSATAPHLFGDRIRDFERDLRAALLAREPSGRFEYTSPDIEIYLVRKERAP